MTERAGAAGYARRLFALSVIWIVGLFASGRHPFDRATWWMEVAPVLIVLPLLWAVRTRFRLTDLALLLVMGHGLILMLGGAYTYARVPIGFTLQEWLGLARNPYDRIGHFAQGFVPAIVIRELLFRAYRLRPGGLAILTVACCLAVSAGYELIEFGAAMALGQGADEFLGTQGDPWDTQWDMLMCLLGAIAALILLSRCHNRQLAGATPT